MLAIASMMAFLGGLVITITLYSIWANQVPVLQEPGAFKRLSHYLTTNVAMTSEHAPTLPELQTRTYPQSADVMKTRLLNAMEQLGWPVSFDGKNPNKLHATVNTPVMGYIDDLSVRIEAIDPQQTRLHLRSSSRIGKADLGANLGHILELYRTMQ